MNIGPFDRCTVRWPKMVLRLYSIALILGNFLYVGCDGDINGQQYDVCGVCGGDNSTCRLVSGLFTRPFLNKGYNYITDIPEQACNLNISSLKNSNNPITLKFKNGSFFMNGDFFTPGTVSSTYAAGTTFTYNYKVNGRDFLFAPGPISRPLELYLVYKQTNTGIKYEYRVPMKLSAKLPRNVKQTADVQNYNNLMKYEDGFNASTSNVLQDSSVNDEGFQPHQIGGVKRHKNKFKWVITSYTPCSRTCGEGTKVGLYSCVWDNEEDHTVADQKCFDQAIKKPNNPIVLCRMAICSAEWTAGDWGSCSVTCDEGVEKRDLLCVREISDQRRIQVNEGECAVTQPPNILRTRPCFRRPCDNGNASSTQPYWRTGTWSMCSSRCGIGIKTRIVRCMAENENECRVADRPAAETSCDMGPCSSQGPAKWLTTDWTSQCTEKCGTGIQTRKAACSVADANACEGDTKPETIRNCYSTSQCEARWYAGPWSSCSVDCGWGKQSRNLICIFYDLSTKAHSILTDENCAEKKPASEQSCFTKECDANWYFSSWSECSSSCDSGIQTRHVQCLNENSAPDLHCRNEDKPETRQICSSQKCPSRAKMTRNIQPESASWSTSSSNPNCTDSINNCNIVIKTRLCKYKYYEQNCCRSCGESYVKPSQ